MWFIKIYPIKSPINFGSFADIVNTFVRTQLESLLNSYFQLQRSFLTASLKFIRLLRVVFLLSTEGVITTRSNRMKFRLFNSLIGQNPRQSFSLQSNNKWQYFDLNWIRYKDNNFYKEQQSILTVFLIGQVALTQLISSNSSSLWYIFGISLCMSVSIPSGM